jgi:uroporphyrinogen decarboxylase
LQKDRQQFVFYHTCGYALALYPQFMALGIDAVNSQVHSMGLENVADNFARKITLGGEIDRQHRLLFGTPQHIYHAASVMKEKLFANRGGLIGHSVAGVDVPLENIKAILTCWNRSWSSIRLAVQALSAGFRL